ncbi:hypothetical protein [Maridesulfovibrio sp.]|uniref:hypothetical protein n=1 Tax=Maridesulfovibrio sp. TaxID=2795000 RepID=UPI003B006A29
MMIKIWEWRKAKGLSDKHEDMEIYKQGFEKTLVEGMFYKAKADSDSEWREIIFCKPEQLIGCDEDLWDGSGRFTAVL